MCVCVCARAHNAGCSRPSELSCHMADGNMYEIHRPIRCKNKEKYMPKKKKNHTQDSIYMVQQFAYVHRVAGILLFSGKYTECGITIFLSKKRH